MGRMFEIPQEHIENVYKSYGYNMARYAVCEEECSELIKSLTKYVRFLYDGSESDLMNARKSIAEELTHVAICLGMLMQMFNISHDEIDAEVQKKAEEAGFDTSKYSWPIKHGGAYDIPKYVKDRCGNVIVNPEWLREFQNFACSQSPLYGNIHIDETESVGDDNESES